LGKMQAAGASSQFPVDAFQDVGRAQAHTVGGGEVEHRQTFRDGNFGPFGQLVVILAPGFQRRLQEPLGFTGRAMRGVMPSDTHRARYQTFRA
jgi:hypothetical protein